MSITSASRIGQSVVYYVSATLGGVAAAALAVHVAIDVALRVFGSPALGTIEYVQFIYMPAVTLGGVAAAQRGFGHITVDLLVRWMSGPVFIASRLLVLLVLLILGAALSFAAFGSVAESLVLGEAGVISQIPLWPGKFTMGVVFIFFDLMILLQLFDKSTYQDLAESDATFETLVEKQVI